MRPSTAPIQTLRPAGKELARGVRLCRLRGECRAGFVSLQKRSAGRPVSRVLCRTEVRRRSFLWAAGCPVAPATYPRVVTGRTSPAPIFGLAPGGVCRASLSPGCWWALTLRDRGPPTFSPLPLTPVQRRYAFCCTFPVLSDGGRYPPPRPVEPGLSSPRSGPGSCQAPTTGSDRPADLRTYVIIQTFPSARGRRASRRADRGRTMTAPSKASPPAAGIPFA